MLSAQQRKEPEMSNAGELVADVASDIETWERRIHPFVRELERLVVAPEALTVPHESALASGEAEQRPVSLAAAYANFGRAWAALPFVWVEPGILPRFWEAYRTLAEASLRAWLPQDLERASVP
jgi:hypothetical protein